MKSIHGVIFLVIVVFTSGCTTYSEEDYGEPNSDLLVNKKEFLCANMGPAEEVQCKEKERKLVISVGADKNCSQAYEYQKNKCKNDKEKQRDLLDKSLKKHIK